MPTFLDDVRRAVDVRTPEALEEHVALFQDLAQALDELLTPARSLVRGGKRLRAQMCAAGWLAAGGQKDPASPALVHAGAALELFQACALVHDDVIDAAVTRRGLPAAHRALAAAHEERGWRGDAETFGTSAAILLGDLLLGAASSELALATELVDPAAARRTRQIFDTMTVEVSIGQYLDIRAEHLPWSPPGAARGALAPAETGEPVGTDTPDDLATVLLVVKHKSARYSVEQPLALGAALAGADRAHEDELRAVGLPFGEAFQLRDDEIGVFGEPATTGKPAGDDLREGKRTALLALTLAACDRAANAGDVAAAEDAALLRARVGAADLGEDEVARIRRIMTDRGARAEHEDLVAARRDTGFAALEGVRTTEGAREVLRAMGHLLTSRRA